MSNPNPKCEYCGRFISSDALDKMYKGDFSQADGKMVYTMYPTPEPWGDVFWHTSCKEIDDKKVEDFMNAPKEKAAERILHAAVKSKDGWIFIGKCHADCFMKARNISVKMQGVADYQGFVTSNGRFVDRKEAAKIAWLAGQTDKEIQILFSEDLWSEQYNAKHVYCEIKGYQEKADGSE